MWSAGRGRVVVLGLLPKKTVLSKGTFFLMHASLRERRMVGEHFIA